MKKREQIAAIDEALRAVTERVWKIEQQRAAESHVHEWEYSKTIGGSDTAFGGRWFSYAWKCKVEGCPNPSNSTSSVVHVPEHFPADLR